jgi:hypothetical protein
LIWNRHSIIGLWFDINELTRLTHLINDCRLIRLTCKLTRKWNYIYNKCKLKRVKKMIPIQTLCAAWRSLSEWLNQGVLKKHPKLHTPSHGVLGSPHMGLTPCDGVCSECVILNFFSVFRLNPPPNFPTLSLYGAYVYSLYYLNLRNAWHPITFFKNLVPTWCVTILWDCGTFFKMINLMKL